MKWNKILIFLSLLFFCFSILSQNTTKDTDVFYKYRTGISLNLALIPHRALNPPKEAFESEFYKANFPLVEIPERTIVKGTGLGQIGLNIALVPKINSNSIQFETGLDFGYQSGTNIEDRIFTRFTSPDTSFVTNQINFTYKIREVFGGGYFVIKSKTNGLQFFTGLGINYYVSLGSVIIDNISNDELITSSKTKIKTYFNHHFYVPLGLEFPLSQNNDRMRMKLISTIRKESNKLDFRNSRIFLTGGVQIQYQFNSK